MPEMRHRSSLKLAAEIPVSVTLDANVIWTSGVGLVVGLALGAAVGLVVGLALGLVLGLCDGERVGLGVGLVDGAALGL